MNFCTASWGGLVALAFASKHPHVVKRLLLGSIGTRPNQKMIETIQRGCAIDMKDRAQMADLIIESFGQKLPESVFLPFPELSQSFPKTTKSLDNTLFKALYYFQGFPMFSKEPWGRFGAEQTN